jgi:hypothetical protein
MINTAISLGTRNRVTSVASTELSFALRLSVALPALLKARHWRTYARLRVMG